MNRPAKTAFMIIALLISFAMPVAAKLSAANLAPASSTEMTVVSNRTKNLVIAITNSDGGLKGGNNRFCVVFQKNGTEESADVQSVSVKFTLRVGKIEEEPITAEISRESPGRYCGHIDLGKQYYDPAGYYVLVRYTDAGGKKKNDRLFLSVSMAERK